MTKTLRGKVHGRTIELDEDPGLPEGQEVEIQFTAGGAKRTLPGPPAGWKAGALSRAAGALADEWTEEDDRILEENYRDRKGET